jgi:ATP-dependent helicase/nuclease subunit A
LTNVGEYEAVFKAHDIPYRFYGGRGLLDRQEVCDLMHALRFAANPDDDVALLGLLRSPLIGISDEECAKLAGPDGKNLKQMVRQHPSCTLLNTLETMATHKRPSEILRQTIEDTGYDSILAQLDSSGGMQASADRLICLAESLEHQTPTTTSDFISFVANLRERNARLGDPPAAGESRDAVQCMTVHTAKGLEFPVVILPDLIRQEPNSTSAWIFNRQQGLAFKLKDPIHPFGQRLPTDRYERILNSERFQAEAEHGRLLYVAMTRARDILALPIHQAAKIKGRWHQWLKPLTQSRVEKIQAAAAQEHSVPETKREKSTDDGIIQTYDTSKTIECTRTRSRSFSVSQLEAFEKCPQEYYLKYVLGVPASTLLRQESEKLAANVRGSIVHGVLEKLDPKKIDQLDKIISGECISQDVFPDRSIIDELAKPLAMFIQTPLFKEATKGKREVRFDWPYEDHIITGYVDWYRETEQGIEIIDFKTDEVDMAGAKLREQEYDLQMTTYALALEHALDTEVAATTLVFLTPGAVLSTPFEEKRRVEGIERIENVIKRITEEDFDIRGIKPPCYKCPYHHNGVCWKDQIVDHG